MPRFIAATVVVLAATATLVGCTEEKEPEPQWTEESAYAAAEETYKSYFESSRFDATPGGAIQYVTGDLYEVQKASDERYAKHTIEVRGDTYIEEFVPQSFRTVGAEVAVEGYACINQETLELNVDDQGWVHPDQTDVYSVDLSFASVGNELKLANLELGGVERC
ncbi:hypothetical protein GCM10010922_05180 [Microbacterium sorbitolivorans]|uniref:Lipoprotein n=1 Tax=Microbacterium sorbitolivorans TaxID=1867410 RepID=A0A367Y8G7_9MICO|nr:hypothetical protein [Microbacterium sorbitolivorans]RCK61342.1 hypothetical protein DTO57_01435 [Microbacterium sorbitolivorans]GGF33057.1 hypothetical protein GCM10010922_05180 [Microbacterium sorbitolivorans]